MLPQEALIALEALLAWNVEDLLGDAGGGCKTFAAWLCKPKDLVAIDFEDAVLGLTPLPDSGVRRIDVLLQFLPDDFVLYRWQPLLPFFLDFLEILDGPLPTPYGRAQGSGRRKELDQNLALTLVERCIATLQTLPHRDEAFRDLLTV